MATVTCEAIRELFSARVDDALSADERARLDGHLATCPECAREWQRFEGAVELLRAVEPARAPAGFVDRVLAARPQPWYRRLARGLLVPWPVKLPLEAAAIVLVAGLAIVIFQRSPELQQASRPPAPSTTGRRGGPAPTDEAKPQAATPAPAEARKESTAVREAVPSADAPAAAAAAPPKRAESPPTAAGKDAESDRGRAAARQAAPTPEKSGRAQTLAAGTTHVEARLAVAERSVAERAVGELVARAGGDVVSRSDDGSVTVLGLAVPGDRWDEVRRDLERLGELRLDRSAPRAGRLRIVLRLER